jgi:hypothetical protein
LVPEESLASCVGRKIINYKVMQKYEETAEVKWPLSKLCSEYAFMQAVLTVR